MVLLIGVITTVKYNNQPAASVYRIALAHSVLVFFVPAIVSDYLNRASLHYPGRIAFFVTKGTIWFFVPFICIIALYALSHRSMTGTKGRVLYYALLTVMLCSCCYYFSRSIFVSVCAALALSMAWGYCEDIVAKISIPLGAAALIIFSYLGCSMFSPTAALTGKPMTGPARQASALQLKGNVYLIVFDELSANALFENGTVQPRFSNFARLQETSLVPASAKTNYDLTHFAIRELLTGRRPGIDAAGGSSFEGESLFSMLPGERLVVFGNTLPYCEHLRRMNSKALCYDDRELTGKSLSVSLQIDMQKLVHTFAANPVVTLSSAAAAAVTSNWLAAKQKMSKAGKMAAIRDEVSRWRLSYDAELARLDRFLELIGGKQQTLFYYHSVFPHFPYIMDRTLKVDDDFPYTVFGFADSAEEIKRIDANYVKTVQAADTVLGLILQQVEREDPDAIVIVTADHGVARELGLPLWRSTGCLIEDVINIPLFVRLPENHPHRRGKLYNYQHIDFLPTFLELVGSELRVKNTEGKSALRPGESPFRFVSGGKEFRVFRRNECTPAGVDSVSSDAPATSGNKASGSV